MKLPTIIAIIRLPEYSAALQISEALMNGGITALEFTFTGEGVPKAVEEVRKEFKSLAVGVGSVRTLDHVSIAKDCGAEFIVTPIVNAEVNRAANASGLSVACGAYTPTEMVQAAESGAHYVKVFPARGLGPHYIKDVLGPLPELKIIPTGGVDENNAKQFLAAGAVAVAVGGSLIDESVVRNKNFGVLTDRARTLVNSIA